MANYVVSDTSLTGIANKIRSKGGTTANLTFPAGFESAIDALPEIKLLGSKELTDSYSSTTAASATTLSLGSAAYTSNGILYVKVRDKAGERDGYFYGTDVFMFNPYPAQGATTTLTINGNGKMGIANTYRTASDGTFTSYSAYNGYGLYGYSLNSSGTLTIRHRYNSTYTLTINGTYLIEVYLLTGPFASWYPSSGS